MSENSGPDAKKNDTGMAADEPLAEEAAPEEQSETAAEVSPAEPSEVDLDEAEDVLDPEPDVEPTHAAPPQRAERPSRLVNMAALVSGGLIAALIGYGLARFDPNIGGSADAIEAQNARLAELDAALTANESARQELSGQVQQLSGALDAAADDRGAIATDIAAIRDSMATIGQRLTDLENRPIPDIGATQDAVAAYDRELRAMREMFEAELQRVEQAQEDAIAAQFSAAAASRQAQIRAALSRLQSALVAGDSFEEPAEELKLAGVTIPPEIETHIDGVTGLEGLADAFPDAARDVLALDLKARAESGEISRTEAFLKSQINARSLVPVEGDTADAFLSRAEAALGNGDVQAALAELGNLPQTGSTLMQDWLARATEYTSVQAAIAEIGAGAEQ